MEYYSAFLKNEKMKSCLMQQKWMQLKTTMLTKTSQSPKDKYCVFSLICDVNLEY